MFVLISILFISLFTFILKLNMVTYTGFSCSPLPLFSRLFYLGGSIGGLKERQAVSGSAAEEEPSGRSKVNCRSIDTRVSRKNHVA